MIPAENRGTSTTLSDEPVTQIQPARRFLEVSPWTLYTIIFYLTLDHSFSMAESSRMWPGKCLLLGLRGQGEYSNEFM